MEPQLCGHSPVGVNEAFIVHFRLAANSLLVHPVAHMKPPTKRLLMRDVADKLGVHRATVSRALRNDSRISLEVRERIQAAARKMGYVPDPALRALADYRAIQHRRDFHGLLAWLTNFPTRDGWRVHEKIGYFSGATQRAAELGYKFEVFWLREPDVSPKRLRQILLARGIRGILLPPQEIGGVKLELQLDGLASVSFGHTLLKPALHVVHHHHYRSMQLLLRQLTMLGYRRPGLALTGTVHHNIDGAWTSAYFLNGYNQSGVLDSPTLAPPLINDAWRAKELLAWWRQYQPDVVISNLGEALAWLREGGVRVPDDCGFVMPAHHTGHPDCAGIDENNTAVGGAAVDLLVSSIEHGELGIPAHPKSLLVEGTWSPGATVRRQPQTRSRLS